jgi:hypothetical protein
VAALVKRKPRQRSLTYVYTHGFEAALSLKHVGLKRTRRTAAKPVAGLPQTGRTEGAKHTTVNG